MDIGVSPGTISPEQICSTFNLNNRTKSVLKASIRTSELTSGQAERSICMCDNEVKAQYTRCRNGGVGRGLISGRIDIGQRPAIGDAKSCLEDWDVDRRIGAKHKEAITSMVVRKPKLTKLVLLDGLADSGVKCHTTQHCDSVGMMKPVRCCADRIRTLALPLRRHNS
ncbi:MAG: hypothetical protein JKY17_09315 [Magnetovibrio sp.]|nr:hypothetical protein [Magnetovibrio sp.]